MSIITNLSSNEFDTIVKKSKCYADICRNLGLRREGGYYRTIKRRIKNEHIDTSHFLTIKELLSNTRNINWITKEEFIQRLQTNHKMVEWSLKKKLKEFDLIPYICSECGGNNIWNKKELVLQLDHIDGDHTNNNLNNLRWLCPNCHSQTETFCGKHKKTKRRNCPICNNPISKNSIKCMKCSNIEKSFNRRKVNRPSKNELSSLIMNLPMTSIGKKFGVSDNAIRKWCKAYNLKW